MSKVSGLQGVPWHKEYLKQNEGESKSRRRDKRRCRFYDNKTKSCRLLNRFCYSSTNCKSYKIDNVNSDNDLKNSSSIKEKKLLIKDSKGDFFYLNTSGVISGKFRVCLYEGKLREHTNEKTKSVRINYYQDNKSKSLPASVDEVNGIIYICIDIYKSHRNTLLSKKTFEISDVNKAVELKKVRVQNKGNKFCPECNNKLIPVTKMKIGHKAFRCENCSSYYFIGEKNIKMIRRDGMCIYNLNNYTV